MAQGVRLCASPYPRRDCATMISIKKLVAVILYPAWTLTQDPSYSIPPQWIVSDEGCIVALRLIMPSQNTSSTLSQDKKIQLLQSVIQTLIPKFNDSDGTIHGTSCKPFLFCHAFHLAYHLLQT